MADLIFWLSNELAIINTRFINFPKKHKNRYFYAITFEEKSAILYAENS